MNQRKIALAFFSFLIAVQPFTAHAAIFDPGLIISETELFQYQTMTTEQIQDFLSTHDGVLKEYATVDIDGLLKTAAMIISDAASRNRINPQFLLSLLQKEQGLITNPKPKETQLTWATGYAACDTCDVSHPGLQKFKGFANQVDKAAGRMRYFVEHSDEFFYKPGETYRISGEDVYIKNAATAALYNYTPHIAGNRILWRLFSGWFRPTTHPDGTLLQGLGEPGVWLIKNGQRHAFLNKTALTSRYSLTQIVTVDPDSLEQYPIGAAIAYAEYSLVRTPEGTTYLLVGPEKRRIASEQAFRLMGFTQDEVEEGTEQSLAFFYEGAVIDEMTTQPLGALLQDPDSFGVYYVQDGFKYPLLAPELLSLNFPSMRVRKATAEELARYIKGNPVLLRDGLLVKTPTDPRVFVIANGRKLPIYSEYTFNSLGYQWSNIQIVTKALLDLHPEGEMLRVEPISDDEINTSTDLQNELR